MTAQHENTTDILLVEPRKKTREDSSIPTPLPPLFPKLAVRVEHHIRQWEKMYRLRQPLCLMARLRLPYSHHDQERDDLPAATITP